MEPGNCSVYPIPRALPNRVLRLRRCRAPVSQRVAACRKRILAFAAAGPWPPPTLGELLNEDRFLDSLVDSGLGRR